MNFKIGEMAVYPAHGVGIVQAIESTLARAEDLKAHYLKRKRELHQTAQLFNRQIVALLQ